jgi:hypothetical protein
MVDLEVKERGRDFGSDALCAEIVILVVCDAAVVVIHFKIVADVIDARVADYFFHARAIAIINETCRHTGFGHARQAIFNIVIQHIPIAP